MEIKKATFIVSNSDYRKCPDTKLPEYAFIGRSNVGKSSLINMLTRNKNLAKTSVKPGKTQLINHFLINDQWYLVDLPGYGYARTSKNSRQLFQKMITDYILHRETLINVFVLIDSRIPPQKIDLDFINFLGTNGMKRFSDKHNNNRQTKTTRTHPKRQHLSLYPLRNLGIPPPTLPHLLRHLLRPRQPSVPHRPNQPLLSQPIAPYPIIRNSQHT